MILESLYITVCYKVLDFQYFYCYEEMFAPFFSFSISVYVFRWGGGGSYYTSEIVSLFHNNYCISNIDYFK